MCGRYVLFTEEEDSEIRSIINEVNDKFKGAEALSNIKVGEFFPTDMVWS
ncbi:MAG: hypothetical protein Q8942_12110 [Bacillota bacterium]|nr:hypothetical protein [Bacillota bacterium]